LVGCNSKISKKFALTERSHTNPVYFFLYKKHLIKLQVDLKKKEKKMYCIGLLSLITVALCQSTSPLVPVKKGYFDITPSTTQVTLTLHHGGGSESINLNDAENTFGDDSSEDMSSQRVLELFSTGTFQLQPFQSMLSEITSNVCLMSLSSDEEHATDSVDYDSAVNKVSALAGYIVANMGTVSSKNYQAILRLYDAAKYGASFDTTQLSLPRSGTGSMSQIRIQVNLGRYSFKLGTPILTRIHTKESQCVYISRLATTQALNLIKISPLGRNNDGGSNLQLSSNNDPYLPTDTTQLVTQDTNVRNTEPSNIQKYIAGSPVTEQSNFSSTDISTGNGTGTTARTNTIDTFGRPETITSTNENSNANSGAITSTSTDANVGKVLPAQPVLPFIPHLEEYPVRQSQPVEQLNSNPGHFQTNPIQANSVGQ
jgi:hypothetical protein